MSFDSLSNAFVYGVMLAVFGLTLETHFLTSSRISPYFAIHFFRSGGVLPITSRYTAAYLAEIDFGEYSATLRNPF